MPAFRSRVLVALALAASSPAQALPLLRLVLHGDARTLGQGGAELFADAQAEALRLERPALLAEALDGPRAVLLVEDDRTVSVAGSATYAGTTASDQRAATLAAVPLPAPWSGARLAAAAQVRSETGAVRLAAARYGGEFLRLWEGRELGGLALSFAPAPWLAAGAAATHALSGPPAWSGEVLIRGAGFSAGWRRATEHSAYDLLAPAGLSRKIRTPPVAYDIERTWIADHLLAGFDHPRARALVTYDLRWPHDLSAEMSARLGTDLVLRLAYEHQLWRFDNYARAESQRVARVNLGVDRERTAVGAEHPVGRGEVAARYVRTRLATRSVAADTGPVAAKTLLDSDLDLSLFFGHDLDLEFHQLALGYAREKPEGLSWRAGVQALRVLSRRGDLRFGSELSALLQEEDSIDAVLANLIAGTGGIGWRSGHWEMWWSVAQLVPIEVRDATARPAPLPTPAPERPRPVNPHRPGLFERLVRLSQTYRGGTLQVVEIVHKF